MQRLIDLANPTRFMRFSATILPWVAGASLLLIAVGLYLAWFVAPADYQQGETIRIMFIHVPAAFCATSARGWRQTSVPSAESAISE